MLNGLIARLLQWTYSLSPQRDETTRLRTTISMLASIMGVFFLVVIGVPLFFFGESLAGTIFLVMAGWLIVCVGLFAQKKISLEACVSFCLAGLMFSNFLTTVLLGGTQGASVLILWSLVGPLLISIVVSPRRALLWGVAFITSLIATLFVPDLLGQTSSLPPIMGKWLFLFDVGGVSAFVLVIVQYFATQRELYQKRSDSLLVNILPPEIAASLRDEKRVVAEAFDSASILFADVVGFTALSSNMSPVELVELLNEIFSHFDSLAEKYGLEKIKTIGDCYMAAAGIPRPRPDHAKAVVLMALEIINFLQTRDFHGQKLAFRIGIKKKPRWRCKR